MTCPICSADTDPAYRPFCSRRCADLDLAKWMRGAYAFACDDPEEAEEAQAGPDRTLSPRDKPN